MNMKTMKVTEKTHKKLTDIGMKGETYSDVIDRLIKGYV